MVPTQKQKKVFEKVTKEGLDFRKAMLDVGYTELSADRPGRNLIRSKGWQILMDRYIPEEQLMKVHKEGLGATKKMQVSAALLDVDDYPTRHKYLETAYKLRGTLAVKEPPDETPPVNINIINILEKTYGGGTIREVLDNS